jgi:hypothetical protein
MPKGDSEPLQRALDTLRFFGLHPGAMDALIDQQTNRAATIAGELSPGGSHGTMTTEEAERADQETPVSPYSPPPHNPGGFPKIWQYEPDAAASEASGVPDRANAFPWLEQDAVARNADTLAGIQNAVHVRPVEWEKFLAQQPPSQNVEDRRGFDSVAAQVHRLFEPIVQGILK